MTTHEADRPVEVGGGDDPTDQQYDPDTDMGVVAETPELVEDESETTRSRQHDAADDEADRTPESDPLRKLAPAGPDAALDPRNGSYQDRWGVIQAGFIDDPRRTVESASALVAEIGEETVRAITDEREGVDGRWQNAESTTDDLRVAMQDYRDMYARLMRVHSADR